MPKRIISDSHATHLTAWRKHVDMTLQALADEIGSSKQNLSNIEKGRTRLTADMAAVIAKRFGITAEMLLAGPPNEEIALELDMLSVFRGASDKAKRAILDSARAIVRMDRGE